MSLPHEQMFDKRKKEVAMSDKEFFEKAMQILFSEDKPIITPKELEKIISTYLSQLEDT